MRLYKYIIPILLTVGLFSSVFAASGERIQYDLDQETIFQRELNERDYQSVIEFLKTRRADDKTEKFKFLTISGDMRFEWRHINEKGLINEKYRNLRGTTTLNNEIYKTPVSQNDTDVEFNLRIDYHKERTWALAHVQFDNGAGTGDFNEPCGRDSQGCQGSGGCDDVCLKRCYIGYNIYKTDDVRFDVELGRRKLYDIFDSYIQFLARFDGLLLKYTQDCGPKGAFYWYLGGFLVDERVNHYAWATELGMLNIYETNFDLRYSLIHWGDKGRNRCRVKDAAGWRFINSQITVEYNIDNCLFSKAGQIYAAGLYNHDAKYLKINGRQQHFPWGWYVGFWLGTVKKQGDWSVDINYQWVQAQAVPDCDIAGIGRGNILDLSFPTNHNGNANYRGVSIECLYAITDNLSIDSVIEFSRAINSSKQMGGRHTYSDFKLEAIYAW